MRGSRDITIAFVLGAGLTIVLLAGLMAATGSVQAGPELAPTPVANRVSSVKAQDFGFYRAEPITNTRQSVSSNLSDFDWADVQTTLDFGDGSEANLITVTLQVSVDNVNWDDSIVLANAAKTTDDTEVTQVPIVGKWWRLSVVMGSDDTDSITTTIIGLAKR